MKIIADVHEELGRLGEDIGITQPTAVPESAVTEFLRTLLWAETTPETLVIGGEEIPEGTPLDELLDACDLPTAVVSAARENLEAFQAEVWATTQVDVFAPGALGGLAREIAEDVYLTQNRHGAGFWDGACITRGGSEVVLWNPAEGDTDHPAYHREMTWATYLTEVAHNLGSFGLDAWVDETTGELRVAVTS